MFQADTHLIYSEDPKNKCLSKKEEEAPMIMIEIRDNTTIDTNKTPENTVVTDTMIMAPVEETTTAATTTTMAVAVTEIEETTTINIETIATITTEDTIIITTTIIIRTETIITIGKTTIRMTEVDLDPTKENIVSKVGIPSIPILQI